MVGCTINSFLLFLSRNLLCDSTMIIHSQADGHLGSFYFGVLWIKLLWDILIFLWVRIFISLQEVRRNAIAGHRIVTCLFHKQQSYSFPEWLYHCPFLPVTSEFWLFTPSPVPDTGPVFSSPFWECLNGISCFQFAFSWWEMMWNTFSYAHWPLAYQSFCEMSVQCAYKGGGHKND